MGLSPVAAEYVEVHKELEETILVQQLADSRSHSSNGSSDRNTHGADSHTHAHSSLPKNTRRASNRTQFTNNNQNSYWKPKGKFRATDPSNSFSNDFDDRRKRPKTHYEVLGLNANASDREIRTAYRKLALQHHPDKNRDPASVEVFKELTTAYAVLSDRMSRKEYDLSVVCS